MAIANLSIGGLPFTCVSLKKADFKESAAIYVIICVNEKGAWHVIDIGQSGELGVRIDPNKKEPHDRSGCWKTKCSNGNIWVCIYKMPSKDFTKGDRLQLEKKLRNLYNKNNYLCGDK